MDIARGDTIGDRYEVQRKGWDTGCGAIWIAFDKILERPVLIETFPDADPAAVGRAVARTAQITHPGLCQIYDMSVEPPGIVFELAAAGRLADRKDGAAPPAQAAKICSQLAAAIAALHERGVPHGSIGPSTVLFDEEGRPKLAPAGVSEELGDRATPDAYRPAGQPHTDESADRYALGAVAYRLFTGQEPSSDAPPARTAKRGIPPEVDALLSRALARDVATRPSSEEFRRVMGPIAAAEPAERGPGFFHQEASWLIAVVLLVALAVAAITFGVRKVIQSSGTPKTPEATATTVAYQTTVTDFDPPPGNGQEHHDEVGFVIDGLDTAWSTVGYKTAAFGGAKRGVGLLFDLGDARSVGRIQVRTPDPGWTAEWRYSDARGSRADDFTKATEFTASGEPVTFGTPIKARYWLLWITRLVNSGNGGPFPWQAQVTEVQLFPR